MTAITLSTVQPWNACTVDAHAWSRWRRRGSSLPSSRVRPSPNRKATRFSGSPRPRPYRCSRYPGCDDARDPRARTGLLRARPAAPRGQSDARSHAVPTRFRGRTQRDASRGTRIRTRERPSGYVDNLEKDHFRGRGRRTPSLECVRSHGSTEPITSPQFVSRTLPRRSDSPVPGHSGQMGPHTLSRAGTGHRAGCCR